MIAGQIAEETYYEIDPLHHLRQDDSSGAEGANSDVPILPNQTPSIHNELVDLSFNPTGSPITVKLMTDAGPGCGGMAWPAGRVLAEYLTHRGPERMKGKSCLELGAGTGLVGIVAAKLGAQSVVLTDQAPLLPIMRDNVALNAVESQTKVLELNWGEPLPQFDPPTSELTLILAADCVYFEPAFPLLVQTLRGLHDSSSPNAEFLFCYKKRRKADKRFFALLKKHFDWKDVEDDPSREVYSKEAISLLRLTKRKSSTSHETGS